MRVRIIAFILCFCFPIKPAAQDSLRFSGQVSSWINAGTSGDIPLHGGVRYIPQINIEKTIKGTKLFDAEFSANIFR